MVAGDQGFEQKLHGSEEGNEGLRRVLLARVWADSLFHILKESPDQIAVDFPVVDLSLFLVNELGKDSDVVHLCPDSVLLVPAVFKPCFHDLHRLSLRQLHSLPNLRG